MYKDRLKRIRFLNSTSQEELSSIIGIQQNTFSEYETEYKIMPTKHLCSLCNYFNVSLDYIFGFSNDKQYNTNNKVNKELSGKRLKEFRKENNLTLQKISKILECSYATIAGYESGRYLIATPFLYAICKKYSISADYLLGKTDEPKYLKHYL